MATLVNVKIKFKSGSVDHFIERYAVDVGDNGIFIRTPKPLAVGTSVHFQFLLQDGNPLLQGDGTVVWIRDHNPQRQDVSAGMGIRFDRLPPDDQRIIDRALENKARDSSSEDEETIMSTGGSGEFDAAGVRPVVQRASAGSGSGSWQLGSGAYTIPAGVHAHETAGQVYSNPSTHSSEAHDPGYGVHSATGLTMPDGAGVQPSGGTSDEERLHRLERDLFEAGEVSGVRPVPYGASVGAEPLIVGDDRSFGSSTAEDFDEQAGRNLAPPHQSPVWLTIVFGLLLLLACGAVYYLYFVRPSHPRIPAVKEAKPPVAAAPAVAAKSKVTLHVESTPAGAKIAVNGKDTGKVTPADLEDMAAGDPVTIRFDLPGKKLLEIEHRPESGVPLEIDLKENAARRLKVESTPPGAKIQLDGRTVGATPLTYASAIDLTRQHRIRLSLTGYESFEMALKAGDVTWQRDGEDEVFLVSAQLKAKPMVRPAAAKPRSAHPVARPSATPAAKSPTGGPTKGAPAATPAEPAPAAPANPPATPAPDDEE